MFPQDSVFSPGRKSLFAVRRLHVAFATALFGSVVPGNEWFQRLLNKQKSHFEKVETSIKVCSNIPLFSFLFIFSLTG